MAQQRETTTDRLVSVIASIKLSQRSGRLLVRRGDGSTLEEGELIFVRGQITQANAGRRSGSDAFNWLSTWGYTRYTFTPATSDREISQPFPFVPTSSSSNRVISSPETPATSENIGESKRVYAVAPGYEIPHVMVDLSGATARINQVNLPRSYRRLYLLIDGRRSIVELGTLLGKSAEEVRTMLQTLERLGIVWIANLPPAEL